MLHDKRILLISQTGQVGSELWRGLQLLGKVIAVDREETALRLDLTDHAAIRRIVQDVKPDIIVNAAAYTAVDQAEKEAGIAEAINAIAPSILAEEAKKLGALLVHYSTDYVYHGEGKTTPYTEEDECAPQNVYGKTKLAGDEAIMDSGCAHLIFRTSWVYGRYGQNFLLTMQRLAAERDELRIVSDQIGSPTWSRLIADATEQVLAQLYSPQCEMDRDALSGIYHLTSSGEASWYDFAQKIVQNGNHSPTVLPILTKEYPVPAKRPLYSVLSNQKLYDTFGIALPSWDTALSICMSHR
jgi:dTDP-4-dehydrorhamnose reductase